jgi:hypothetical protein
MIPLLAAAIGAHGGLDTWNKHDRLTATIVTGGAFWAMKGLVQDPSPRSMRIALHREWASVDPFGKPGQHTDFTAARVAIETDGGVVVAERRNPRAGFAGHTMQTPWDPLDRAYFNGYALWTYLATPFALAMEGFHAREIDPWMEDGETWRGLRATFPDTVASHSREQDFYFGPDMLLRRHDYHVDIAGGFPAAQYVSDYVDVDGIRFPSKRRAYVRGAGMQAILETPMVTIDLSDLRFD